MTTDSRRFFSPSQGGKCKTASPERWIMAEQIDWSKMLGAGYFRDRTVLITGASSGIGRDIAMSLSRMGALVAMLARRKALLDELKGQLESAGARALALGAGRDPRLRRCAGPWIARSRPSARSICRELGRRPDTGQCRIDGPGGPRADDGGESLRHGACYAGGPCRRCAPDPGEIIVNIASLAGRRRGYRRSAGTVRRNSRWSVSPKHYAWNCYGSGITASLLIMPESHRHADGQGEQ